MTSEGMRQPGNHSSPLPIMYTAGPPMDFGALPVTQAREDILLPPPATTYRKAAASPIRLLIESTERERSELSEYRVRRIESSFRDKEQEMASVQARYGRLKDDFEYNLRLLAERDADLARYEATVRSLRTALARKEEQVAESQRTQAIVEAQAEEEHQRHAALQQTLSSLKSQLQTAREGQEEELRRLREEMEREKSAVEKEVRAAESACEARRLEVVSTYEEMLSKRDADHESHLADVRALQVAAEQQLRQLRLEEAASREKETAVQEEMEALKHSLWEEQRRSASALQIAEEAKLRGREREEMAEVERRELAALRQEILGESERKSEELLQSLRAVESAFDEQRLEFASRESQLLQEIEDARHLHTGLTADLEAAERRLQDVEAQVAASPAVEKKAVGGGGREGVGEGWPTGKGDQKSIVAGGKEPCAGVPTCEDTTALKTVVSSMEVRLQGEQMRILDLEAALEEIQAEMRAVEELSAHRQRKEERVRKKLEAENNSLRHKAALGWMLGCLSEVYLRLDPDRSNAAVRDVVWHMQRQLESERGQVAQDDALRAEREAVEAEIRRLIGRGAVPPQPAGQPSSLAQIEELKKHNRMLAILVKKSGEMPCFQPRDELRQSRSPKPHWAEPKDNDGPVPARDGPSTETKWQPGKANNKWDTNFQSERERGWRSRSKERERQEKSGKDPFASDQERQEKSYLKDHFASVQEQLCPDTVGRWERSLAQDEVRERHERRTAEWEDEDGRRGLGKVTKVTRRHEDSLREAYTSGESVRSWDGNRCKYAGTAPARARAKETGESKDEGGVDVKLVRSENSVAQGSKIVERKASDGFRERAGGLERSAGSLKGRSTCTEIGVIDKDEVERAAAMVGQDEIARKLTSIELAMQSLIDRELKRRDEEEGREGVGKSAVIIRDEFGGYEEVGYMPGVRGLEYERSRGDVRGGRAGESRDEMRTYGRGYERPTFSARAKESSPVTPRKVLQGNEVLTPRKGGAFVGFQYSGNPRIGEVRSSRQVYGLGGVESKGILRSKVSTSKVAKGRKSNFK